MDREAMTALYRAHATARLRGEAAEARRLADQMGIGPRLTHLIFLTGLFGQVVTGHFGADLDRVALGALTKRLHAKHHSEGGRFRSLKAEGLVRAIYGEGHFLIEIAHAEQPGYMWAVMCELVDPASSDADLEARFDQAEALSRDWLADAIEGPVLSPWVPPRGNRPEDRSEEDAAEADQVRQSRPGEPGWLREVS